MIPLTRSRLNRYNAGVIDLSSSYRRAGGAEHPPAPGTPSRKRKLPDEEMESVKKEGQQRRQQWKQINKWEIVSRSESTPGQGVFSKASMDTHMEDTPVQTPIPVFTDIVAPASAPTLQSVLAEPISNSESSSTQLSPSAQSSAQVRAESGDHIESTNTDKEDEGDEDEEESQNVAWCERKKYDEERVTREKLLLYAKEIMAQEAYDDEENPHLSIRPLYKEPSHGRMHPTTIKKRLAAMYWLHLKQCQQSGRQESNLEDDVTSETQLMIEEYTKMFIAGGGSLRKASSASSQENDSVDDNSRDGINDTTVETISSSREPSVKAVTASAISPEPASDLSSSSEFSPKSASSSPDSSSNNTTESSGSSSQAASASSDASSDVASASSDVSANAASESSDPSSTSSKSSYSSVSSSTASSSSSNSSSTITSEPIPMLTPSAKTEYDGSVPAATLLTANLSQSATILYSPEPVLALVPASNSSSTSTLAGGPPNSVPFDATSYPESTFIPTRHPFAPWAQECTPSSTEKQVSFAREETESGSGDPQGYRNYILPMESRNLGTIRRHHSMQVNWNEWCIRKKYADGNLVTPEKFITYVAETTSGEPFEDKNNPHLSVRPLYRKTPSTGGPVRVSKFTFCQYLTSIRFLHKEQCRKNGLPISDDILKGNKIRVLLNNYEMLLNNIPQTTQRTSLNTADRRGQTDGRDDDSNDDLNGDMSEAYGLTSSKSKQVEEINYRDDQDEQDVQDQESGQDSLVTQDERPAQDKQIEQSEHGEKDITGHKRNLRVYSIVPLRSSMCSLWTTASNCPSLHAWKSIHQRRLRAAFDYFTKFEHDLSMVLPCHLHLVHVWSENNEALFTTGIAITKVSKEAPPDEAQYSIFLREKDVEICPVGALAFYLLAVFSGKSSVPDFRAKDWESKSFLSIEETSRVLDGVNADDLIADTPMEDESNSTSSEANDTSFNSSPLHRLTPLFLPTAQQLGSYMLTATFSDNSAFYLPRSRVIPPAALQKQLFPFIEDFFEGSADWQTWIDNIMMDRPLDTSRPEQQRTTYKAVDFPAIRFMRVLSRLRKVILQDFAVMMTCNGGSGGVGSEGQRRRLRGDYACLAHHPVFSTPEFLDFAAQLHEAMGEDADFSPRSISVRSGSVEDAVLDLRAQQEEEEGEEEKEKEKESVLASSIAIQKRAIETGKDLSTSENAHQRLREIMELLSPSAALPVSIEVQEADKHSDPDSGDMEVQVTDNQNDPDYGVILQEAGGRDEVGTVVEQELELVIDQESRTTVGQESMSVLEQEAVSVVEQASSAASPKSARRQRVVPSNLRSSANDLSAILVQDIINDNNNPDVASQDVALQDDTPQKPPTNHVAESLMDYEAPNSPDDNQGLQHKPQRADHPASDAIPKPVNIRVQKRSLRPRPSSKDLIQPPTDTVVQDHPIQKERRSSLGPLAAGLARVSINTNGQGQQKHANNNAEQLRQVIQTLSARVAFLEQEKKNKLLTNACPRSQYGLPTPEPPSATPSRFSIDTAFQDKGHGSSSGFNQYRFENQALREKLAYLEQENKALEERNLQLLLQDQLYDAYPNIVTTTATPTSTSVAPHCSSESNSVLRLHGDDNGDMSHDDESAGLEQEIQSLRVQLAVKEQEKNATLGYTVASIESAEFLDGKMVQMEQSMHGLWIMMASSEATRFAVGPSSSAVLPQHQQQQQQQDKHDRLRLRVDAMRRRIGSNAHIIGHS
ncbi:hypothetical protein BGZ95_006678 [Linnemannia exigua]|uniref:Uncharacterized protein n=1 Tax=Linnemannia exigua TaxID=604196 RepID=A0AAD4H8K2_9FUNG|nr:hypothetical protein BGZ95_006678 [Linnemannia exigua]